MLTLTRKVGEKIMIGTDIIVTVTSIHHGNEGDRVKLGIEAPRHVRVMRSELVDREPAEPVKE